MRRRGRLFMGDFLLGFIVEIGGELVCEAVLEWFCGWFPKLPRKILYGASWRQRARREVLLRRRAMKGMA
jgi:hypothetical protein